MIKNREFCPKEWQPILVITERLFRVGSPRLVMANISVR